MLIVIDLFGDSGEEVAKADDAKRCAQEAERKRHEEWFNWVRHHEAVVPQVVPVTQE